MNLLNEIFKTKSSTVLPLCTPCCPFETKNIPHPRYSPSIGNIDRASTTDACCLSKLQVNCRIRCPKKKRKLIKYSRYDSIQSSPSSKRSVSLSSALSTPNKQNRFGSSTNTNYCRYQGEAEDITVSSSSSTSDADAGEMEIEVVSSSSDESIGQSKRKITRNSNYQAIQDVASNCNGQRCHPTHSSPVQLNQKIEDLKSSIDQLTKVLVHSTTKTSLVPSPRSWFEKFRCFFEFFHPSSKPSPDVSINDECCQILERHHLSKANLISIYQLFDRNETLFLKWLRSLMPEPFLPLLLNYVQHFSTVSSPN